MLMDGYCEWGECEKPKSGHGIYCAMHTKRRQRGRMMNAPEKEALSPEERALKAGDAWVDADPMDDADYEAKRRAFLIACKQLGRKASAEAIREGIARRKALGLHVGGKLKLSPEAAAAVVSSAGGIRAASRALGMGRNAIRRALRAAGEQREVGPRTRSVDPRRQVHEYREDAR